MEASFGRPPDPASLGYQAALDAGFAASEAGATQLALSYFEHAVTLRATSIALAQKAKCLRDLGRDAEAVSALREAVAAPGGGSGHARVLLIAVLCDAREYDEALQLANQAAVDEPQNPAVLNVTARVLEELADTLARGSASAEQLAGVRAQARRLRATAREVEPEDATQRLRRRRERAFPLHSITPAAPERLTPVDQRSGVAVGWHLEPKPAEPRRVEAGAPAVPEPVGDGDGPSSSATATPPAREGLLQRLRRLLTGRVQ
jgi:tetratricopeptide (TPR) repeat protein